MKNIIKFFGLLGLIGFSFFYTDKVMNVIMEQDPIMIQINNEKDKYETLPANAIIEDDTIIPGKYGKVVKEKESYNSMKNIDESAIENLALVLNFAKKIQTKFN